MEIMQCPVCGKEAALCAEVNPNGKIGCFCRYCEKGYSTKDPINGWKEHEFTIIRGEAAYDLKTMHNVDVSLEGAEKEFEEMIAGVNEVPDL